MKKICKTIRVLAITSLLIFSFSGCKKENDSADTTASTASLSNDEITENINKALGKDKKSTTKSSTETSFVSKTIEEEEQSQNDKYKDFSINNLSDCKDYNIKIETSNEKYKKLSESSSSVFLTTIPSSTEIASETVKDIKSTSELEGTIRSLNTLEPHTRDKFEVTKDIFNLTCGNRTTYLRKDKAGVHSVLVADKKLSQGHYLTESGKYLSADGKTLYIYTSFGGFSNFDKSISGQIKDTYTILSFSLSESEKDVKNIVVLAPATDKAEQVTTN